jgi:hypothetical protein
VAGVVFACLSRCRARGRPARRGGGGGGAGV